MNRVCFFFIVLLAIANFNCLAQTPVSARPAECQGQSVTEQALTDQIFAPLGSDQRPVLNSSHPVIVNITFALSSINDIIEKQRLVKLTGYISIRWYDQLRRWNTTYPLNCITSVVVSAKAVWLPDVALMNADGRYALMELPGEKVRIHSDGYSIFSPGGTFNVYCDFDLSLFPFDVQLCPVKFESWRYTHSFMQFALWQDSVKLYQFSDHEQWELVGTTQTLTSLSYFEPENSFDRVEFYLKLRRKSRYYIFAIIIPGMIISLAQLAIFALPLEEANKIYTLFTCLLAYMVFQLMIVGDLPRSSDRTPLLSNYVNVSMAQIAVSIFCESVVFVLLRYSRTHHPEGPGDPPRWMYAAAVKIGRGLRMKTESPLNQTSVLFVRPKSVKPTGGDDSENRQISTQEEIEKARLKWRFVADVWDRIIAFLYIIAVLLVPFVMFIIYPNL